MERAMGIDSHLVNANGQVTWAAHGWVLPFAGGWPGDMKYRQTPMFFVLAGMFLLVIVATLL
jgi:hypothetical protein